MEVSFLSETSLKAKIEADGKMEQQIYDKYACWCETTSARKANDIHTGFIADNIDALLDITEEEALHFEAPAGEIGEVGDAIDMTGLEGTQPLPSPMESTIVEILVEEGETILKNQVNPLSPSVHSFRLPVGKNGR